MSKISEYRLLSFDVYGTLIDWEGGITKAFQPLVDANPSKSITRAQLLKTYYECEHAQQTKTPDMLYPELLATCHSQVAERLDLPNKPTMSDSQTFASSIGTWQPFPDTTDALHRLGRHFKLVVLSNVDRTSFAATNAGPLSSVTFDLVLTAQDIGSYKPNPRNFHVMLEKVHDLFGVEKCQVLQTAQSQFHDQKPARELGIKGVWIERPRSDGEKYGRNLDGEDIFDWKFDTLGQMADLLDEELKQKQKQKR